MKWYENNILLGIASLTIIALFSMWLITNDAKEVVMNIVTGIAAFVTGYVAHGIKDATTTISQTTTEQTSNVVPIQAMTDESVTKIDTKGDD